MEPDERPRVAIVGAGPSGLAAAHHLADTHQVWLFDKRSTVGGVWATSSDQAYKWLETNTPSALFPFPGFPLTASDWKDEPSRQPYVSGPVAQRYYARYAHINRLDEQGRLKGLKLSTTVLEVKRPSFTEKEKASHRWLVTFQEAQKGVYQIDLPFERLIIATGHFSTPSIPISLRLAIKEGFAFHSSSFGSSQVISRLGEAKKVVIVGAGKSAQDVLTHVTSSGNGHQSVILVIPGHGQVSSWPLPHGHGPSYLSRIPFFGSGYLSPWSTSSSPPTWISKSRLGSAIRRYYWNYLAQQCRVTYPLLFPDARSTVSWRDILRSTTRLFPAPPGLSLEEGKGVDLSVLHATVTDVITDDRDESVTLALTKLEGGTQTIVLDGKCDTILACTGYLSPSREITALFATVNEADKMGIPVFKGIEGERNNDEWHNLVEDSIRQIRQKEPMLAQLYTDEELFDQPVDTYRLFHHIVPFEQAHISTPRQERDFAVIGLPQTISASIVANVQARWLSQFFAVENNVKGASLQLPASRNEAAKETAHLVAASISRYGPKDCRQGTAMTLELAWYTDLLLNDHRFQRPLRALSSDDFQ